ncbi:hypothetical protein BH10PLA1_BH10PLA1_21720 [soil metagenome]
MVIGPPRIRILPGEPGLGSAMRRRYVVLTILILLTAGVSPVRAGGLKSCAVLTDESKPASALAALVEAQVQQAGKLQLVDRERIKDVIAERKLVATLGADAAAVLIFKWLL